MFASIQNSFSLRVLLRVLWMFRDPAESPDMGRPLRLIAGESLVLFPLGMIHGLFWPCLLARKPMPLLSILPESSRSSGGGSGEAEVLKEVHTLPPWQWGCSYFPCPLPLPKMQTGTLRPAPDLTSSAGWRVSCLHSFLKSPLPRLDTTTHEVAEAVTEAQKDEVTYPQSCNYNVSECGWTKAAEMLGADLVRTIPCSLQASPLP